MRLALCALLLLYCTQATLAKPPNIVFIVADDLGWNDVGFNNPDIISPNIDALAHGGVILNQSYVQPVCTPSRNAFMSGYYPFRAGLQHGVILPQQAVCAPLDKPFLPQELKKLGYATHAVGKWHLGFCSWNCTPTYRGFDTFFGFYNGKEDYYTYDVVGGYDFRDNKEVKTDQNGTYSTYVYQEHLQKIISAHDPKTPLFLYVPMQSVHRPLEAPKVYTDMYPNLHTDGRRNFSGQVTALDDVIGNLTAFIKAKDMYNDTIFVFTADNGGWTQYFGNNWPLRGGKVTVWEGGTRASAFVHGNMFASGKRYDGLMHAVDWFPTLITAAGGQVKNKDIDGVSMWEALTTMGPSPRTEVVYNIDDSKTPLNGHAAIRQGEMKLIQGFPGKYSGWYPPDQNYDQKADQKLLREFMREDGPTLLYNLTADPTEHHDLARSMPDVVKKLEARLEEHRKQLVPPNFPGNDPKGAASNFGGVWTPGWC